VIQGAVFNGKDAEQKPAANQLTIEDPRIREMMLRLPRFIPGQPISVIGLGTLPTDVRGTWALVQIAIHAEDWTQHRILPLFVHDDGRLLPPTARRIWEELFSTQVSIRSHIEGQNARAVLNLIIEAAETHGRSIYEDLLVQHKARLMREEEKGQSAFAARRRAIERVGLPEVRRYRLAQLAIEKESRRRQLDRKREASPELTCILALRVEAE
jgi:hypothetical protein